MQQLTFIEETREEKLQNEVRFLREQYEKIRKGQFAKISEVKKIVTELHNELENLKISICQNTKAI